MLVLRWLHLCILCGGGSAWLLPNPVAPFGNKPSLVSHKFGRTARCISQEEELQGEELTQPSSLLQATLIASDAILSSELLALEQLIQTYTPISVSSQSMVHLAGLPPGATGRVALLKLPADQSVDDEFLEEWEGIISQQIDEILYSQEEDCIRQPILVSFASEDESSSSLDRMLQARIQEQTTIYGLADPVQNNHKHGISAPSSSKFVPSLWYEVDGAMVMDGHDDESTTWDTSSILVFDDLVSSDLRARMLDVVLGSARDWKDEEHGPDPSRWCEGGLIDLPDEEEEDSCTSQTDDVPVSFGLTEEALEEICQDDPPPAAFEEFETMLATLFEDFTVTRLPEAVLGAGVSPLTANAPCFGQSFSAHIDADPFFCPPSPWTDVYGRYANRARGKPRFVSCLVYLNEEWDAVQWGAPTRFYDVATETAVDVSPKPGRVVIMDQDITHTVVAPFQAAGKRPRYSLVWKLILHPKQHDQDMRHLSGSHLEWPIPVYVGSAKR